VTGLLVSRGLMKLAILRAKSFGASTGRSAAQMLVAKLLTLVWSQHPLEESLGKSNGRRHAAERQSTILPKGGNRYCLEADASAASLAEAALGPQSHEGKQGMLWPFACDAERTRGLLGIVELCRKHSTLVSLLVIRVLPAQARAGEVEALHWRYRGVVLVLRARRQPQVSEPNGRAPVAGAVYVARQVLRQTESRDPYQAIETPPATPLPR